MVYQYGDEIGNSKKAIRIADELNGRLRRRLGYKTLEELFDAFLDSVYAA